MKTRPFVEEDPQYTPPPRAGLFCGLIVSPEIDLSEVLEVLEEAWGGVGFVSRQFVFGYTRYYEKEMGPDLLRFFSVFKKTVSQEGLPELKWTAKRLERFFSTPAGDRRVNIDPGLLLAERLVLATTKACGHRPYLGKGIYADLTLVYQNRSFQALPWTYPDYASEETIQMMNELRRSYVLPGGFEKEGEKE